jgi:hypothetical protein
MAIGADVTEAEPAMIGTRGVGTEMSMGVDRAWSPPRQDDERGGGARGLGPRLGACFTGLAQRFVDVARERFGRSGALLAGLVRFDGRRRCRFRIIVTPEEDEQVDQHQDYQEEFVK